MADDPQPPPPPVPVDAGMKSTEFYLTLVAMLGCFAGAIILLVQGKTSEGMTLIITATGLVTAYTAVRGYVKRGATDAAFGYRRRG